MLVCRRSGKYLVILDISLFKAGMEFFDVVPDDFHVHFVGSVNVILSSDFNLQFIILEVYVQCASRRRRIIPIIMRQRSHDLIF